MFPIKYVFFTAIILLKFQIGNGQNLVANPSFELSIPFPFENAPSPFFRTSNQGEFNNRSKGFLTVYNSTPDFISSDNHFMEFADFGNIVISEFKAKTGKMAMGIRILGCKISDICCREVIQIPLLKPMQANKQYHIEFWAARMVTSPAIPLGVFFGDSLLVENPMARGHHVKPQIFTDSVVGLKPFQWVRIVDTITAKSAHKFMNIGNFIENDDQTPTKVIEIGRSYPRAYYFIDDVSVIALEEMKYLPVEKPLILSDLNFKTSEWLLLPSAYPMLDALVKNTLENPNFTIEITGHTDNKGRTEQNQLLSERRAKSVKNYLVKQGISEAKITVKGMGEMQPIAENTSENGRKLNRRVEVVVKK